jgi:putative PIN family toxin of toxin-antitoxin system
MKVILDTNCLVVALSPKSPYHCLWKAFRQSKFSLCYSTEILQEYEEILSRFYSPATIVLIMETLLKSPNVIQNIPYYRWNMIKSDPDDNKFVDCALNAGADFIVTNDRHFNILKEIGFPRVNIVDIESFRKMLTEL